MTDKSEDHSKTNIQGDSNDDLSKRVIQWLDEQGYPLEMYTARCCRDSGMAAYQSWYYLDKDSGQQRETDVFAHTRRIVVANGKREFQLSLTLECKQSRGRPWVAFIHTDDSNIMGPKAAMTQRIIPEYSIAWWLSLTQKADQFKIYPLQTANPTAHSLVRVSFNKSNEDAAYGALMSTTKAAIGISNWLDQVSHGSKENSLFYTIIIPVLVVDAPLFSCRLDNEGKTTVTSIDQCTLQWSNQISVMSPTTIIEIVTKAALPYLLHRINTSLSQVEYLTKR